MSSSSLKPWPRTFCPSCNMTKETGKAAADQLDENQPTETPKMFKARLVQRNLLKQVIGPMKNLLNEATGDCTDSGTQIQATENPHASLAPVNPKTDYSAIILNAKNPRLGIQAVEEQKKATDVVVNFNAKMLMELPAKEFPKTDESHHELPKAAKLPQELPTATEMSKEIHTKSWRPGLAEPAGLAEELIQEHPRPGRPAPPWPSSGKITEPIRPGLWPRTTP